MKKIHVIHVFRNNGGNFLRIFITFYSFRLTSPLTQKMGYLRDTLKFLSFESILVCWGCLGKQRYEKKKINWKKENISAKIRTSHVLTHIMKDSLNSLCQFEPRPRGDFLSIIFATSASLAISDE